MQVMMMMILTVMIRVTIIMNSSSYREEPVAVILNILIRQRRNAKKISLLFEHQALTISPTHTHSNKKETTKIGARGMKFGVWGGI